MIRTAIILLALLPLPAAAQYYDPDRMTVRDRIDDMDRRDREERRQAEERRQQERERHLRNYSPGPSGLGPQRSGYGYR